MHKLVFRFTATTPSETTAAHWAAALNDPRFANWFIMATDARSVEGYIRTSRLFSQRAFWRLLQERLGHELNEQQLFDWNMDAADHFAELAARTDAIWHVHSTSLPCRRGAQRQQAADASTAPEPGTLAAPPNATEPIAIAAPASAIELIVEQAPIAEPIATPASEGTASEEEPKEADLPATQTAQTRRRPRFSEDDGYEITIKVPRRMVRDLARWMAQQ
jgi:hypothetical protein